VLLIILWRASYHSHATTEPYAISGRSDLTIEFYHGQIALILSPQLPPNTLPLFLPDYPVQNENRLPGIAGFASLPVPGIGNVTMAPVWFASLLAIAAGATPWLRWRFSLRTLLIATTLVAVGLGLIVFAARG
jgi:hypothetical protein